MAAEKKFQHLQKVADINPADLLRTLYALAKTDSQGNPSDKTMSAERAAEIIRNRHGDFNFDRNEGQPISVDGKHLLVDFTGGVCDFADFERANRINILPVIYGLQGYVQPVEPPAEKIVISVG